ncbi:MAG: Ig-like domain-containing protein [Sterolibacterium sp.]|nr:Ig-like domain-containing protein [Sterolibacterium sp.]
MKNKYEGYSGFLTWFMALLLSALAVGCGGGGGGDPIVGGGGAAGLTPTVTTVAPLPSATGVPINTKIFAAVFSGAMDSTTLTTTSFTLACPSGTPVTGTVTYLAAGNVATLTLPAATSLPPSTVCTVTVTSGAKSAAGIPLASNFVWTFTTGLAPDTTAPTVTLTAPLTNATGVASNTKAGATFSELMDPATITTNTFILKQGTTAISGTVTYIGVSAAFTPASNLAANTTYTATITTGAKDLAGNALASDYVWSWTTGATLDTTPPTVTGTIQTNGQTNVAINTKAGATFSEAMDPLTISNLTYTLKNTATGTAIAGVVSYSGVNAVFIPTSNLASSTNYTVTVKGGVNGAKDLAGNPLASDFVISWTTAAAPDTTPPTVTGTIPANSATNVAINTSVGTTFSEAMDPLTITNVNITLKNTATSAAVAGIVSYSGVSAVFIPTSTLAFSTNYTVTVKGGGSGVKDLAGNPMTSDFVWNLTTGAAPDTTAPTVVGTINANGATNVAVNTKAGATFSEGMDPLTITNANFTLKNTATSAAVAGTLGYAGLNATFIPLDNLAYSTGYTATIKGGASGVKDLAGNPMASDYVWNWTTGAIPDTTAPTVTSVDPVAFDINVSIYKAIKVTFSEAMDPLTINTAHFTLSGGISPATGTVVYDMLNKTATFTPQSNLEFGTMYTVLISTGAKDLAGNALASGLVPNPSTFTTALAPGPTPPPAGFLRTAAHFAVLSGTILTNTVAGTTIVKGDVGSYTMNVAPPLAPGYVYATTDPTIASAVNDMKAAVDAANLRTCDTSYVGNTTLNNTTVVPGVYCVGGSLIVSGSFTLNGPGEYIIRVLTTLNAATGTVVGFAGGATDANTTVYWVPVGATDLAAPTTFKGTIMSKAGAITFEDGANMNALNGVSGRALSGVAVNLLANNIISIP